MMTHARPEHTALYGYCCWSWWYSFSGPLTWTRFQNCVSSATARVGVEQSGPRMKTLVGGSNRLRTKPRSEGVAKHYTEGKAQNRVGQSGPHSYICMWSTSSGPHSMGQIILSTSRSATGIRQSTLHICTRITPHSPPAV